MTDEKLIEAQRLKGEIEKTKNAIRLLKEGSPIYLAVTKTSNTEMSRIDDEGSLSLLLRHLNGNVLKKLEAEFEKL